MSESLPLCSVIIPTYNRAQVLRRCLDALARQTVPPHRIEIIVADDGSTDETGDMVASMAAGFPCRLQYFRQENAGANAARNAAIRIASAPILLIINDDTIAVPELAARHLAMHASHPEPGVAVLGRMTIDPALPASLFAALHHEAAFGQFAGKTTLGWEAFFTCNLSVQRDFLLRFGLFDEALRWHEDIELGERLAAHGMRLLYCPDALGYHHHLLHEADYFRIALREGRSLVQWQRKRHAAGEPDNAILHAALQPALRHRIADTLLNRWTMEPATMAARALARIQPAAARLLYARLFQRIKRRAIDEATAKSSF